MRAKSDGSLATEPQTQRGRGQGERNTRSRETAFVQSGRARLRTCAGSRLLIVIVVVIVVVVVVVSVAERVLRVLERVVLHASRTVVRQLCLPPRLGKPLRSAVGGSRVDRLDDGADGLVATKGSLRERGPSAGVGSRRAGARWLCVGASSSCSDASWAPPSQSAPRAP